MLMMIQGHTIYALADTAAYDIMSFPWNIWHFCRGLTAPVFLMVSGAVHVFANKRLPDGSLGSRTIKKRITIASVLIGIGYLLVFPAERVWDLFFIETVYWQRFFCVNILQLFGISLLMILILFIATKNNRMLRYWSFAIAMAIIFFTPVAAGIPWFSFLPMGIADYLSYEKGSIFAIFPFAAYLFLGVGFGTILEKIEFDKRLGFTIKWGMIAGAVMFGIGFLAGEIFSGSSHTFLSYKLSNPGLALIRAAIVLAIISIVAVIYKYSRGLGYYYSLFGRRALFVYIAHLIIIYGTPIFPGVSNSIAKTLHIGDAILIAILIQLSSLIITYAIDLTLTKLPASRTFYKYAITSYLIYILFI